MSEAYSTTIVALLATTILLLLWIALSLGRISRQLQQTTTKPCANPTKSPTPPEASSQNPNSNSDFERFLAEDPQRQLLAKKEQAAAYRTWRKQNGLTWNA